MAVAFAKSVAGTMISMVPKAIFSYSDVSNSKITSVVARSGNQACQSVAFRTLAAQNRLPTSRTFKILAPQTQSSIQRSFFSTFRRGDGHLFPKYSVIYKRLKEDISTKVHYLKIDEANAVEIFDVMAHSFNGWKFSGIADMDAKINIAFNHLDTKRGVKLLNNEIKALFPLIFAALYDCLRSPQRS